MPDWAWPFLAGLVVASHLRIGSRLSALESKMSVHDTQLQPLWARAQTVLINDVHRPHIESKELDDLLDKLKALTIKPSERKRLRVLLQAVVDDSTVTQKERDSAEILIKIMGKVLQEAAESVDSPQEK